MKKYNVIGMSCAACQARVEKAVSSLTNVDSVSVNLLTNSMDVEGSVSDAEVIKAVENAGYKAYVQQNLDLEDKLTPIIKKRLFASLGFLVVLMFIAMGPLPTRLGLIQLLLSATIIAINRQFFISGFKVVIHKSPNMDTLVSLGSGVSFIWSVYALISGNGSLFFDSAAMILVLITVGKMLEAKSKGKTTDAIKDLVQLKPQTATIINGTKEVVVLVDEVKVGDIFIVKPGELIPVDGVILEGNTAVNESALTGESLPVDKSAGDSISSATINMSGFIKCKATFVGQDTTLSKIIKLVSDASSSKAPIARVADKVAGVFVPVVIGISLITLFVWLILGSSFENALTRAISVLVISCPCSLGLATPVAIMVGSGLGAKHGILFKNATALEVASKAKCIYFDKTGTITNGNPEVVKILTLSNTSERDLISYAYSIESKSEHPIAKAIVAYANANEITKNEATNFNSAPGFGVSADIGDNTFFVLSPSAMDVITPISEETKTQIDGFSKKGWTPVLVSKDKELLGIIAVADTVKSEAKEAVQDLYSMKYQVCMLSGDNNETVNSIAKYAGINQAFGLMTPESKAAKIKESNNISVMVGDGINDAPALTSANVGIAIGTGTDVAIDAADIIITNSNLKDVVAAIKISKATLRNIYENLFWAFFYNVIGISIAAGCWGIELSPMIGAGAMSLSSICVVLNALRLNLFNPYKTKEKHIMTKTMIIEGMMCSHCEARVKKTLEAIEGVVSAEVSHEKGTAIVSLSKEIDDSILKAQVEEQGYKVI